MESVSISNIKPQKKANRSELPLAVERVKIARQSGDVSNYHKQLAEEYKSGFSLQDIAKGLGLGSAAPLYYGAQRSLQKGE
jgi:hypothetical protein